MRRIALVATAVAIAGCGGSPGNTIEVSARGLGSARTLLVTENGQGSCNGGKLHQLAGSDVIAAREIAGNLKKEITGSSEAFTSPSSKPHRTFSARTLDGTVQWSELHRPLPPDFSRAELLLLKLCP